MAMALIALQVVALQQWPSMCCRSRHYSDGQRCSACSCVASRNDVAMVDVAVQFAALR